MVGGRIPLEVWLFLGVHFGFLVIESWVCSMGLGEGLFLLGWRIMEGGVDVRA